MMNVNRRPRPIASARNITLLIAAALAAYVLWWRQSDSSAPAICANESSLASAPSTTKTELTFRNSRDAPIRVYGITPDGKRQKYADLEPGALGKVSTYLGHPWVVTDADDRCLGVYMPEAAPREFVVR